MRTGKTVENLAKFFLIWSVARGRGFSRRDLEETARELGVTPRAASEWRRWLRDAGLLEGPPAYAEWSLSEEGLRFLHELCANLQWQLTLIEARRRWRR